MVWKGRITTAGVFSLGGAPVTDALARGVYRYTSHIELIDTWTERLFAPLVDAGHSYFLAVHAPTVTAHVDATIREALVNVPHKVWYSDVERTQWARTLVVLRHFFDSPHHGNVSAFDATFVTRPDLVLKAQLPIWEYVVNDERAAVTFPFVDDGGANGFPLVCDTMIVVPRRLTAPFAAALDDIAERDKDHMAAHRYLLGALAQRNVSSRYMLKPHFTCGTGGFATRSNPLYEMHGRDQRLVRLTIGAAILALAGGAYCAVTRKREVS